MQKPSSFDQVAQEYDQVFTTSQVGLMQRKLIHDFLSTHFKHHSVARVLELNCGTGTDACWLAAQGKKVLATDISEEMIKVGRQKKAKSNDKVHDSLTFKVLDINNLAAIKSCDKYDLIFSNFGGLNCLDEKALKDMFVQANELLNDGGYFVAVVMGRFCLIETLFYLAKRQWAKSWRRLNRKGLEASIGNQASIKTYYYSPSQFFRFARPGFRRQQTSPVGFFLPPSYLDHLFSPNSKILRMLNWLERKIFNLSIFANAADHFLIALKKAD